MVKIQNKKKRLQEAALWFMVACLLVIIVRYVVKISEFTIDRHNNCVEYYDSYRVKDIRYIPYTSAFGKSNDRWLLIMESGEAFESENLYNIGGHYHESKFKCQ
jgi:hypothetical protein